MALNPNIVLSGITARQNPTSSLIQNVQGLQNLQEAPFRQQLLEQRGQLNEQALAAGQRTADLADQQQLMLGVQTAVNAFEAGNPNGVVRAILDTVPPEEQAQELAEFNANQAEYISGAKSMLQAFQAQSGQGSAQRKISEDAAGNKRFVDTGERVFPDVKRPKEKSGKGLVWDPESGTFSIDPIAKQRFDEIANKAKTAGGLDFKEKQGLNKDVTNMLKSTVAVRRSAEELDKLKGIGSAAAKLGAVFKFMKALDPTSVVRETEQGQVYSASGAAAQLAGAINSLLGEGKLTDKGFRDLVATSKGIANANIESVDSEVNALLDSFEETLPESFKDKLNQRVPRLFKINAATPPQTDQQGGRRGRREPTETVGRFKVRAK